MKIRTLTFFKAAVDSIGIMTGFLNAGESATSN